MEENTSKFGVKNAYLIIIVLLILALFALGTYALLVWTSTENTEVTFKIGDLAEVMFHTGNDVNVSNLGPVFDYEKDGESTNFSVLKLSDSNFSLNIKFTITSLSDNLKRSDFKWIFMSSNDNTNYNKINEGNFSSFSSGSVINLLSNYELTSNTSYKFIVYIDGNEENPISMQGGSLAGYITAEANKILSGPFNDAIISLSNGDSWESGASGLYATNSYTDTDGSTKYHEYRYVGAGVNNYVKFNNDMYQIIGVFDENSHGVADKYLVKLIAVNLLSSNSYGIYNRSNTSGTYSSYKNDWTGNTTGVKANANILLNEYFYNKSATSSTYGECGNWTYYYSNTNYRTNDCTTLVGYGIDLGLQNYIETTTWYLYGYSGNGLSKQNFYLCERGGYDGCTSGNSGAYATSTTEKIGLMYVSDYMYASGYYSSTDTTTGSSYYYGNKNWLYKGLEWMITPRSDNATYAFDVSSSGYTNHTYSDNGLGLRPTFYLKSDVYVTGGNGSFDNPYMLSCNTCG